MDIESSKKTLEYRFQQIDRCDMCGSGPDHHRIRGMRLNQSQGLSPRTVAGIAVTVKQCTKCGLIFSDPQPRPADLLDHYGMPPEDYWDPQYFQVPHDYFANEISRAKQLLGFQQGMKALDIGAGIGKAMKAMDRAGFETHGIEPSQPFFEYAVAKTGIAEQRITMATIEEAELPESTFDFVTFGAVLEHLFSPFHALERALSWVKPGGIVHAEVPSSRWLIERFVNTYYRLRGTNYVTFLSPMHPPFHLFQFGLRSFKMAGERLGFSTAFHEHLVCSVYHVPKVLHPPFRWLMNRTSTGMQLAVYLRRRK